MGGVWMVRHAPVEALGLCYGQHDVATVMDASTAAAAIERAFDAIGTVRWDEVWSSPWQRTLPVAALLATRAAAPLRPDPRLSELAFGEWEGRAFSELEASDGVRFHAFLNDYEKVAPPGGETADALVARVAEWLAEVDGSGRTVLAVTHAGAIRAARASRAGRRFARVVQAPVAFLVPELV